ncbi:DNA polymerase I [bacterium]|nr:MAG: DNA polymerase I [bacterium]
MDLSVIKKDALFIIDGSYFLYRSYYALPPLHTPQGKPTHATFAFCRTINKLIKDFDPKKIVVTWDSKSSTATREEVYAEYKATRQAAPNDLFEQKEDIITFIKLINMCTVSKDNYEADDLIASLVKENPDEQIVIVCADKDMYQLLSHSNVLILDTFKNKLVSQEDFITERGFQPAKIPFFYSLLGDASDNIPGVKGIGKKTAEDLVKQFDSLENLYQNIESVEKKRTQTLLSEQKDNALLSLKLFLPHYTQTGLAKKDLDFDKNNWHNAADFFEELNFKGLIKENTPEKKEKKKALSGIETQQSLFESTEPTWECVIVSSIDQLKKLLSKIEQIGYCGLDTETSGSDPLQHKLVGLSFAYDHQRAYYIPLQHPHNNAHPQIPFDECIALIKPLLESDKIEKYLHNTKFDELVFWNNGITLRGTTFDTLIAANLMREAWQKINLKNLSLFFLNEPMRKFKEVMGKEYKSFDQVPIENGAEYGAHDALQTLKLKEIFEKKLATQPTLEKLFYEIEMPLYHVLTSMEKKGIVLDAKILETTNKELVKELTHLEEKIFAAIYHDSQPAENEPLLNLNSPKQIETLLFDKLGLPSVKKNKGGSQSTDHEVLEKLSKVHPIPALILRHRELAKLKNTYLDPLPLTINPTTHRVHTSYSQTMTATGRLSSNNPNLQNIPASSDYGFKIRSAFIAPAGHSFIAADYSQIELRVLAHLSGDQNLIKAFQESQDIHTQTAAQLFGVQPELVTQDQRQIGKKINFSIIYGKTAYGLSQELEISTTEAKKYIETYFAQYPHVRSWMETVIQKTLETGYVETWWGKRRFVPELAEKNKIRHELGRRIAINTAVQGTAADIMKIAMNRLDQAFTAKKMSSSIILQIHDELVIETPTKELFEAKNIVLDIMQNVTTWQVPLDVSIKTGQNWGQITK